MKGFFTAVHDYQKTVSGYVVGALIILVAINVTVWNIEDLHTRIRGHSYWFNYVEVRTTEQMYPLSTKYITLISKSTWHRSGMNVSLTDSLQCRETGSGNWEHIGTETGSLSPDKRIHTETGDMWRLNVKLPDVPSRCRVQMIVELTVNGYDKRQVLLSNEFGVVRK